MFYVLENKNPDTIVTFDDKIFHFKGITPSMVNTKEAQAILEKELKAMGDPDNYFELFEESTLAQTTSESLLKKAKENCTNIIYSDKVELKENEKAYFSMKHIPGKKVFYELHISDKDFNEVEDEIVEKNKTSDELVITKLYSHSQMLSTHQSLLDFIQKLKSTVPAMPNSRISFLLQREISFDKETPLKIKNTNHLLTSVRKLDNENHLNEEEVASRAILKIRKEFQFKPSYVDLITISDFISQVDFIEDLLRRVKPE